MAVESGKDFAYARKVAFVFGTGPGNGFAVLTRSKLVMIPFTPRSCRITDKMMFCDVPKAQMPLAIFEHRFCTPCGVRMGTQ